MVGKIDAATRWRSAAAHALAWFPAAVFGLYLKHAFMGKEYLVIARSLGRDVAADITAWEALSFYRADILFSFVLIPLGLVVFLGADARPLSGPDRDHGVRRLRAVLLRQSPDAGQPRPVHVDRAALRHDPMGDRPPRVRRRLRAAGGPAQAVGRAPVGRRSVLPGDGVDRPGSRAWPACAPACPSRSPPCSAWGWWPRRWPGCRGSRCSPSIGACSRTASCPSSIRGTSRGATSRAWGPASSPRSTGRSPARPRPCRTSDSGGARRTAT